MGLMVGAGLDLANSTTIALGIVLAFVFGFLLTMLPLVRATVPKAKALKFALASDTLSITLVEIVDNTVMVFMLGAMDTALGGGLFCVSLFFSLAIAGLAAFPLLRWLTSKGKEVEFLEVNEAYSTHSCSCCGSIPDSSPKGRIRSWSERLGVLGLWSTARP